jgi:hypothetical protein
MSHARRTGVAYGWFTAASDAALARSGSIARLALVSMVRPCAPECLIRYLTLLVLGDALQLSGSSLSAAFQVDSERLA